MKTMHQLILRANALYLGLAATGGLISDLRGIFLDQGPVSQVVAAAPHAGIGFVEAHGLALIIGVLLWRATPARSWHFAAVAVHVLLGTANLVFWEVFVAGDMLAVGYITTSLHWLFVALQLYAASEFSTGKTAMSTKVAEFHPRPAQAVSQKLDPEPVSSGILRHLEGQSEGDSSAPQGARK